MIVRRAMLLAAGLGTRMRPLTDRTAKPLLPLGGRALLDHALDRLRDAGVETVVVNAHWQADLVAAHLDARAAGPRTVLRREPALLDTGGSVAAALDLLGEEPFFVVNGDAFWLDGPTRTLDRLAGDWRAEIDATLLVHRAFQVQSEIGAGDFALDKMGRVRRRQEREVVPYVYAGVQLTHAALFRVQPDGGVQHGRFSMNVLWDRAIAAGRLSAVVHDGLWFHLSTPPDLAEAEYMLHARPVGETR